MVKRKTDRRTNNDLQNTTQKTKDRATQTPLRIGGIMYTCSTSGIRRVTLVTIPVISHELGKDQIVITTNGTCPWSSVTKYSVVVNQVMVATVKRSK